jgi:sugar lactone lactonase YvrE
MRNAEQQHDSKSRRASLKHWLLICLLCWFTAVTGSAVAQVTLPGAGLINTVAGTGTNGYSGDGGLATNAELSSPDGAAVDSAGNIYVADTQNCRIRKLTASTGIISTIAGNGTCAYAGDSKQATSAELFEPSGVAVDSAGNIYIADWDNSRIRKVTASTGIITTVAGNGSKGFSGDGNKATSAKLNSPFGVALDSAGNIYIADVDNYRIRKVTVSTGFISTVAGNGTAGYSGDGGAATSAELVGPTGVAVDAAGNIYIADSYGDRIRKVTASTGIISTVAGNGFNGHSGDGGPATSAELYYPYGVAVDTVGNIYIADSDNYRIRKVTASTGIISTMAGNGTCGYSGNGGTATSAELCLGLGGLAVDGAGNVYIADQYNERTRAVAPIKIVPTVTWAPPAPISYGTALSATQLDASTTVTGTFAYSPPSGTLLVPGSQTLSVTFTPTDLIDYSPVITTVPLTVAPAVPTITWAPPATISYGTALSATQLDATANVAGTLAYTPAAGTVLAAGTQTLSVTFTPTNSTDYTTATGTVQLMVSQTMTTVTVTSSADPSAPGASVTFTAKIAPATATGTATFTDGNTLLGTVAVSGGVATFSTSTLSAGSHSIVAAYSGDNNDSGSTSSVLTQTVQSQSLAFVTTTGQMVAPRYGQTATQLTTGQVLIAGGMNLRRCVRG